MHRRASVAVAGVAVLALSGIAVQGAMANPAAPRTHAAAAAATPAEATAQGRALFAGLTFAQGDVAQELADSGKFVDVAALREQNSTAEQRRAATALLDKIQKERPQFFGSFAAKLRSGDPNKVQSGIDEARDIMKSLAAKAEGPDAGQGVGQCATVVLAVNVLVAVNLGGAVNVSVAVNLQAAANVANEVNFWFSPPSGGDQLSKDEQVAELTKVLAA
ncbi:sporulation delaying protein family toxin [Streptomyces sp. NPDC096048]|uniref:sporulation delaying protein family toxin n=1 Tax=Streptomyces sp. NPDC096048 TaxID=3366072 RepID=UPI00380A6CD0